MSDRFIPPIPSRVRYSSALPLALAVLAGVTLLSSHPAIAWAQDAPQQPAPVQGVTTGTLVVTVKGTDGKLLDAIVNIESASTLGQSASTDANTGIATLKDLKPETYTVSVTTILQYDAKSVPGIVVKAGETTNIVVELKPKNSEGIIKSSLLFLDPDEVSNVTIRDKAFFNRYPLGVGNKQSLTKQLASIPGFVPDAINQIHPRGENSIATAYYVDGMLLPSFQAGRAAQFLMPNTIDKATVRVGGIPARYGGGSGAIVDLDMSDPGLYRTLDYDFRLGGFDTRELYVNIGNSAPLKPRRGQPFDPKKPRLRYMFNMSQRYTNNALESPQSGDQTAFNDGASEIFFGKIGIDMPSGNSADALFNFSSGRTNIAQQTFSNLPGVPSQQALGQRLRQKDNNSLVMFQFHSTTKSGMKATYSLGAAKTTLTQINFGTPNVFGTVDFPSESNTPFIPTVGNDEDILQIQADFVPLPLGGVHQLRYGVVYHDIRGTDSYQLVPQSLGAINTLGFLDPLFVPANNFAPPLVAKKDGGYGAVYAEDTFVLRNQMRFNVGARIDSYRMNVTSNLANVSRSVDQLNKTDVSPRINISYLLPGGKVKFFKQPTLLRVSYNRLFAVPNLNQGSVLATQPGSSGNIGVNGVGPQIVDLYDVSIERQLGTKQVVKLSLYSKDIKRTLTTSQFIYGLQSGTLAVFNQGAGVVDGAEISYEFKPTRMKNGNLVSGFLVYANSGSAPDGRGQTNNLGQQVTSPFYSFDQQDTLTAGIAYELKTGAKASLSLYYGSGLLSSAITSPNSQVPIGGRDTVTSVNVQLSTGPRFLNKKASIDLGVENLFGSEGRLNYSTGIAGIRYQQGRRILLGVTGRL